MALFQKQVEEPCQKLCEGVTGPRVCPIVWARDVPVVYIRKVVLPGMDHGISTIESS